MAALGSRGTGLFRSLLSLCWTRGPGQTRTGLGQHRCLTSVCAGTWNSQLSRLSHRDLYQLSVTDPDQFWGSAADRLRWVRPFDRVQDCELRSGKINWFVGGKLNVSGEFYQSR